MSANSLGCSEELFDIINDYEERITKLESTVSEQAKRIEALDRRMDSVCPDPFGEYADDYPSVGHPDRRDTQTPEPDCATCASFKSEDEAEPCLSCVNGYGTNNNWTPKPSIAADLMAGVKSAQAVAANLPWIVLFDSGDYYYFRRSLVFGATRIDEYVAREYAAACHIPIITETQWKELTK